MGDDLWRFETRAREGGYSIIAGVDEAGRGPLAGPVVSTALILPRHFDVPGVTDSKKLSAAKRIRLYDEIYKKATAVGIGIVDPFEIDRINILQASLLSMSMAVENLDPKPDFILVDGKFNIPSSIPQNTIIKGDSRSITVAAASIVAKVTRDRLMERMDETFPEFGFARHKGYPTKAHKEAIKVHGCCFIHRKSYKGVKEHL